LTKKIIGIIGCGAIGSALAEYASKNMTGSLERIIFFDIDPDKATSLMKKVAISETASSKKEVIDRAHLVIETATKKIVPELLKTIIEKKKDLIVLSIGGLLGCEDLIEEARKKNIRIILPSGAISGIDALKASKIAGLESVTLTTRKAPKSIKGAPYLEENGIDVDALTEETVVFEGNAREAMEGFPKNVNVSALLSIAGLGAEKTKVKIVISPDYTKNIHEIEIISKAGSVTTKVQNIPSPSNPKTSYLAALAAITALENYFDSIRIGT